MAEDKFEDSPRPIPERFRASLNLSDEAAHALLLKNDAQQKELGSKVNSPFSRNSPREAMRAKALITLGALEGAKIHGGLVDAQGEQLAEAYALIGRYDLAADTTANPQAKEIYEKYWNAVWLPDDQWCSHGNAHKYIKERIFSIKEGKEMPMMACNICRTWNVVDDTGHLAEHAASQSQYQGKTAGMNIQQAQAYHQNNVTKNSNRF